MWKSSQASPRLAGCLRSSKKARPGGGEVDEQEGEEEDEELVEVGGVGGFGMEVFVDEVVDDAGDEHEVDEWGDQTARGSGR